MGSPARLTLSTEARSAELPSPEEQHGAQVLLRGGNDDDCHDEHPAPQPQTTGLVITTRRGERLGTITFEDDGPDSRRLTSAQRAALRDDIGREIARLEQWAVDHGWRHAWPQHAWPQHAWPQHAWPQLDVIVADRYRISKSLVPAWNGNAGRMELPAWRVAAGKAAIMHELVHVLFPNANRFLAEGLAIYLQAAIGGNPAFPNFGQPLHGMAREVLQELVAEFASRRPDRLDALPLAELDAIATPEPLTLRIGALVLGEEPRGQARLYPLAGSFTQHLIETRGLDRFHAIYTQTPLVPHKQSAGSADRWFGVYGCSLAQLERQWRIALLASADGECCADTGVT